MRKILLILILLLCQTYFCSAQRNKDGNERVDAIRTAYITNQLKLTPDEAQRFWPVYNSYISEVKKAKEENPNDVIAYQEKLVSIRKKYKADFKEIVGSDTRVNDVFTVEGKFINMLNNELKNRHQGGQLIQGFRRLQ